MSRLLLLIPVAAFSLWPFAAAADTKAEAGEAARGANCTPSKTEVLRYKTGEQGEVVYRISCQESKDAFIHVRCQGRTCVVLRPPNEFSIR